MTDKSSTIQQLPVLTQGANNDLFIIEDLNAPSGNANSTTKAISVSNLFGNSQVNVIAGSLATNHKATPANSIALTLNAGEFFYDNGFIYVVTASNHIKRVALSDF
jgi:hypothetical protein